MYRPLPECLTIKESETHGLGLFAVEDIEEDTFLGCSHVKVRSDWVRTPLGGFYNHSDDPNCIKQLVKNVFSESYYLGTLRPIKAGEELTVSYTFYKVK